VFVAVAIRDQLKRPAEDRDWQGRICGVPYDFRRPTLARLKASWWNPQDHRIFTPRTFGKGWSVNFATLLGYETSSAVDGEPES
jgi:hypothetical protein